MVAIAQQSNLLRPRSNLKLSCICHRIRPHFCTTWSMNGRIVRQPPLFSQFRHNLQQNFKQTATSMPPLSRRGLKSSLKTSAILTKKKRKKLFLPFALYSSGCYTVSTALDRISSIKRRKKKQKSNQKNIVTQFQSTLSEEFWQ